MKPVFFLVKNQVFPENWQKTCKNRVFEKAPTISWVREALTSLEALGVSFIILVCQKRVVVSSILHLIKRSLGSPGGTTGIAWKSIILDDKCTMLKLVIPPIKRKWWNSVDFQRIHKKHTLSRDKSIHHPRTPGVPEDLLWRPNASGDTQGGLGLGDILEIIKISWLRWMPWFLIWWSSTESTDPGCFDILRCVLL